MLDRSLVVRWVVRSIPYGGPTELFLVRASINDGGPTELFLVPASAPRLVNKGCGMK